MKYLLVLSFIALCGLAYARPGEKYTTKYDNVDLEAILKNDRLLRSYVDCLLEKKKCTKDGETLKKNIPDALGNGCSKCSNIQKEGTRKMIYYLIKEKRPWWNELQRKYDPRNNYVVTYKNDLRRAGIVL